MSNPTEEKIIQSIRAIGATKPGYFGKVELSFKDGRICLVRQERTFTPSDFESSEGSKKNLINGNISHS